MIPQGRTSGSKGRAFPFRFKRDLIPAGAALFLVLSASLGNGQQNPPQILKTFVDRVYEAYVAPNNWDYNFLVRKMPGNLAAIFGSALRQQMSFATDESSRQAMAYLIACIKDYFKGVAAECGYVDTMGAPVTGEGLWKICRQHALGEDALFKNNPGLRVNKMTSVLTIGTDPSYAHLFEEEAIELLNLLAPPAPPLPRNEPDIRSPLALNPDKILGNWYRCDRGGCLQLNISAEGSGSYVGVVVGTEGLFSNDFGWPQGVPVLHAKFDKVTKNFSGSDRGVSYSGKYLTLRGSDREQTWFNLSLEFDYSPQNEERLCLNSGDLFYRTPKR